MGVELSEVLQRQRVAAAEVDHGIPIQHTRERQHVGCLELAGPEERQPVEVLKAAHRVAPHARLVEREHVGCQGAALQDPVLNR